MLKHKPGLRQPVVTEFILDASALLAVLLGEKGADAVRPHLRNAKISSLGYAELLAQTLQLTGSLEEAKRYIDRQQLNVIAFDAKQAAIASSLRPMTQAHGLSLADRACLALGILQGGTILTADRNWGKLNLKLDIQIIR